MVKRKVTLKSFQKKINKIVDNKKISNTQKEKKLISLFKKRKTFIRKVIARRK